MEKIFEIIRKYNSIYITGHKSGDGDSFGSTLSFCKILQKKYPKKQIKVVYQDEIPRYIKKLGYENEILTDIKDNINLSESLLIILDTANEVRIALDKRIIDRFSKSINIDHHISNEKYASYNYVENISSVSEMVYNFSKKLRVKLDIKIAELIYLGIINDTGNFRHSNTTDKTFTIASNLKKLGVDTSKIYFLLFSRSFKKARMFAKATVEAKYIEKFHFIYYYLDDKTIPSEDTDGISEMLLTIENVNISMFLKKTDEGIKASIRSKTDFNVSKMANKLYQGGGHIKASGFLSKQNIDTIIKEVLEYMEDNINEKNN